MRVVWLVCVAIVVLVLVAPNLAFAFPNAGEPEYEERDPVPPGVQRSPSASTAQFAWVMVIVVGIIIFAATSRDRAIAQARREQRLHDEIEFERRLSEGARSSDDEDDEWRAG